MSVDSTQVVDTAVGRASVSVAIGPLKNGAASNDTVVRSGTAIRNEQQQLEAGAVGSFEFGSDDSWLQGTPRRAVSP